MREGMFFTMICVKFTTTILIVFSFLLNITSSLAHAHTIPTPGDWSAAAAPGSPGTLHPTAANQMLAQYGQFGTAVIITPALVGGKYTLKLIPAELNAAGPPVTPQLLPHGMGFGSYNALINHLGSAGAGRQWHLIVEKTQIDKSGFSTWQVNNKNNIVAVPGGYVGSIHGKISGHFSSKTELSGDLTVREWLAGQSFEFQFKYGMEQLKRYGTVTQTQSGWMFTLFP